MSGWIKLHRKSLETDVLADFAYRGFWDWMLLQAARRPTTVLRGRSRTAVRLQPGQLVISASAGIGGMTEKQVRTALRKFAAAGMIDVESRRTSGSCVTIRNWLEYQDNSASGDEEGATQGGQRADKNDGFCTKSAKSGRTRGRTSEKRKPLTDNDVLPIGADDGRTEGRTTGGRRADDGRTAQEEEKIEDKNTYSSSMWALDDAERAPRRSNRITNPADLTITPELRALAERWRLSPEVELEKFRNWTAAKGRRHKDATAAFRNWLIGGGQRIYGDKPPGPLRVVDREARFIG